MRILYDSKDSKYKTPFGCVRQSELCRINIDIPASCMSESVFLDLHNEHTGADVRVPMFLKKSINGYDTFSCGFSLEETGLYFYSFFIHTRESDFALYKENFADTNIGTGEKWQLSCIEKDFSVPQSFQGKVMYQIFPDRFHKNGNPDLSQKLTPFYVHENQDDVPDFRPDENGVVRNCDFFGGNLNGIKEKLPYIKSLGVSIIYLNPIFKAYSNHRYDTCDYKKIDPMLGDEADFKALCDACHDLGIKIILDGVFSHTGSNSIYFDREKIFGTGAYSNPDSPYKDWYSFSQYPEKYASWWGIETLPAVNEMNKSFLDYVINDDDSVVCHWLKLGADGFRLDVADELPDEFIALLRNKVKKTKPESFVLGEVWEDASNKISYSERRKYFVSSELDSVMNYVFRNAIVNFVTDRISGAEFSHLVMNIAENYPGDALNSTMNSLSTHDTARILNELSGCEIPASKESSAKTRLSESRRAIGIQRLFLASFLQFVLPGNACIYYGDEIGMEGFGDPFCREYFKWGNIDEIILSYHVLLGKIKNEFLPLQKGDISMKEKDGVLVIKRTWGSEIFTSFINKSGKAYAIKKKNANVSHLASQTDDALVIFDGGFAAFSE